MNPPHQRKQFICRPPNFPDTPPAMPTEPNPYEPPRESLRIHRRRPSPIHKGLAAVLMVLALVFRYGVQIAQSSNKYSGDNIQMTFLIVSILAAILWVWGCCHLAKHFGLSGAYGLAGLLFLLGPALIFWASRQKPKWDRAKVRRPLRQYRGDPNSPY